MTSRTSGTSRTILLRDVPNHRRQAGEIDRFVAWRREYARGVCHLRRVLLAHFGGRHRATADLLYDVVRWHVDEAGLTGLHVRERTNFRALVRSDRSWGVDQELSENAVANIRARLAEVGVVTTERRRSSLYRGAATTVYTLHFGPLLRLCADGALAMVERYAIWDTSRANRRQARTMAAAAAALADLLDDPERLLAAAGRVHDYAEAWAAWAVGKADREDAHEMDRLLDGVEELIEAELALRDRAAELLTETADDETADDGTPPTDCGTYSEVLLIHLRRRLLRGRVRTSLLSAVLSRVGGEPDAVPEQDPSPTPPYSATMTRSMGYGGAPERGGRPEKGVRDEQLRAGRLRAVLLRRTLTTYSKETRQYKDESDEEHDKRCRMQAYRAARTFYPDMPSPPLKRWIDHVKQRTADGATDGEDPYASLLAAVISAYGVLETEDEMADHLKRLRHDRAANPAESTMFGEDAASPLPLLRETVRRLYARRLRVRRDRAHPALGTLLMEELGADRRTAFRDARRACLVQEDDPPPGSESWAGGVAEDLAFAVEEGVSFRAAMNRD